MEDSCWVWIAASNGIGYGKFWMNEKLVMAHRASYELYIDTIPDGLVIDHLCGNRSCVNPYHLEAVTQQENIHRSSITKKLCEHGVGHTICQNGCKAKYQKNKRNNNRKHINEYQKEYMREYRKNKKRV